MTKYKKVQQGGRGAGEGMKGRVGDQRDPIKGIWAFLQYHDFFERPRSSRETRE